ncbi:MAG: 3-dehydroquinate dehydratase [Elusimicrobia bacterium GWA2_61_42]|nr:MAG: 3-dehydroquinate dehydratase [Elusimicrobia bacterium GWA2_61_42]OGR76589.1 MAG: 3-dehydroquinate dehydratase [Elusimicrobia bacterium GWC2_61_25]
MNVLVIHGPNLHLLGRRKPQLYGTATLARLNADIKKHAAGLGLKVRAFQANGEGEIIDLLTANAPWADALVINPAAYTHYSYAIRDAIEALELPSVEVHLTDISKREPFRRRSVIKPVCRAQFKGGGPASYFKALEFCASLKK